MNDFNNTLTTNQVAQFKTNFEYLLFKVGFQLQDKSITQIEKLYAHKYLQPRKCMNRTWQIGNVNNRAGKVNRRRTSPSYNLAALLTHVNRCIEMENLKKGYENKSCNPNRITVESLLCNT